MKVANDPNQAGSKQQTSFKLISFHFIPIVAMSDATLDMTFDPEDDNELEISHADLEQD